MLHILRCIVRIVQHCAVAQCLMHYDILAHSASCIECSIIQCQSIVQMVLSRRVLLDGSRALNLGHMSHICTAHVFPKFFLSKSRACSIQYALVKCRRCGELCLSQLSVLPQVRFRCFYVPSSVGRQGSQDWSKKHFQFLVSPSDARRSATEVGSKYGSLFSITLLPKGCAPSLATSGHRTSNKKNSPTKHLPKYVEALD